MVRDVSFSLPVHKIYSCVHWKAIVNIIFSILSVYDSFDLRFLVGTFGKKNSNEINPLTTATFVALTI